MARFLSRGGSPRLNREINKALVMRAIRRLGPLSRADIARETGINPNTISTIVAQYMEAGLVREVGEAPSGGGRPAVLVELDASGHSVIGVEIGERVVRATLVDFAGHAVASALVQPETMKPEKVVAGMRELVERLLRSERVREDRLLGVGVAVPGVVSPDGRRVLYSMPLGWTNEPLGALLDEALGARTAMVNNAQAISNYYSHLKGGMRYDGILIFLVTFHPLPRTGMTNLGCGIILKGEVYGGHHHMAGEIAIGLPHPINLAVEAGLPKANGMRDLLARLRDEPAAATRVWDEFCRNLVMIASRSIDLLNPDLTIICSDLPELEELIGARIREQIAAGTVLGAMSKLEGGPEAPRVDFEVLKSTAAAHGAALPFLAELEQVREAE
jgi:Transcriptional regulator/sugar kinase